LLGCSWGNEYLEQTQPWKLAKEGKLDEAKMVIARLCRLLLDLSQVLSIFLPQTAEKIRQILQHQPITKAGVLFPKVE
jgi:methionyl-tRNA synthetase